MVENNGKNPRDWRLILGICVALAALVWLVFGQTRGFDFVNYDDGQYITDNRAVTAGVTAKGVAAAFSAHATDNWVPLTTLSHMVDCQWHGLWAGGHHLTNVALHGATVIFLFLALVRMMNGISNNRIVSSPSPPGAGAPGGESSADGLKRRMQKSDTLGKPAPEEKSQSRLTSAATTSETGGTPVPLRENIWKCAFVAAVFAVHPLRVESVAWISERKDVLCGVFFMLTLWAYAIYASDNGSRVRSPHRTAWYWAAIFFGACALMSKPVAVTLPFVLLLLDYWPINRFVLTQRRKGAEAANKMETGGTPVLQLILEKIPFLILSVAACLPTILTERPGIAVTTVVPIPLRIENAIVSCAVYIRELVYPADLTVFYPLRGLPPGEVAVAAVLLAAVTLAVIYWRRRHPYLLAGWLWYLVMLVPVIGLVQVGAQAHADRHTYLSEIGLVLLLTWLAGNLSARLRHQRLLLVSLSTVILAALIYGGRTQVSYWRNSGTLWSHAIVCDRYDTKAYYQLGDYLDQKKDLNGAITNYECAITIDPQLVGAHNNLGMDLAANGNLDGAMAQYREAIKLNPDYAIAHYNLALALLQKRETDEAINEFKKALAIDPAHSGARSNPDLALPDVTDQRLKLEYAEFHIGLGSALAGEGLIDEAIVQYKDALKNNPGDAKAHNNLGTALRKEGKMDEAIGQYQESLKIDPGYAPAYFNLGNALLQEGQVNDAITEYESALKLKPDNRMVQNNLAHTIWMLATSPDAPARNGTNAVAFAQRANQLADGTNPLILRVLAAAQAESGHFPEAIETAKAALTLATQEQNFPLQNALQQEISQYQASSPVRADPTDMTGWQ